MDLWVDLIGDHLRPGSERLANETIVTSKRSGTDEAQEELIDNLQMGPSPLQGGLLPLKNGCCGQILINQTKLLGARTLLGAVGLTTRSKDATRSKGHRY